MGEMKGRKWEPTGGAAQVMRLIKALNGCGPPRSDLVVRDFPNSIYYRGGERKHERKRLHAPGGFRVMVDAEIDDMLGRLKAQALKDGRSVHIFLSNTVMRPSKTSLMRKAVEEYLLKYFPDEIPTPPWHDDPDAVDPWRSM